MLDEAGHACGCGFHALTNLPMNTSALSFMPLPQDQLVRRAVIHGGDNDSTGTIACAWWGALHGFRGVPSCNWKHTEGVKTSRNLGLSLLEAVEAGGGANG